MRILIAIGLFVLWLALSASFNVAHVVVGAVVACVVTWLNPLRKARVRKVSWPAAIGYLPWLIGRILKSGIHVSRLILHPKLPIAPRLIRHETKLRSDSELVVLGNSITLTPGTITVEIAPGELVVHAIDAAASEDLVGGALERRVSRIFPATEGDR